ncbi:MAG: restriction endonuclease subunit S, partial [Tannerellaceae bacterium]|nr:restriction endonuclease subunit S [Tannerellaceae bacterium]
NDLVLDNFFSYILELDKTNFQINNLGEGGVRIYLWYELFSMIKCEIPSLPEQQKIASFLSAIDQQIEHVGKQIDGMKEWKKGLLQQLFV